MKANKLFVSILAATALTAMSTNAMAEDNYPSRAITMVCA